MQPPSRPQPEPDFEPEPLTGTGPALILLGGLVISFVLFVYGRIWLIPPLLPYTPVLYLIFWVPMLIYLNPKQRPGARVWLLITLLALVIVPCCCMVYAPTSGLGIAFEPWSVECIKLDGGTGQAHYLCRSSSYSMEFRGPAWSPFVRLTEIEGYDSISPDPLPTLTPAAE